MLLSDARVQIARPKADSTDPSASRHFALSEIYLLLARARAHTQAPESLWGTGMQNIFQLDTIISKKFGGGRGRGRRGK
jgi:hypothetical protein